MRFLSFAFGLILVCSAWSAPSVILPDPELEVLLDAPATPSILVDPQKKFALLVHLRELVPRKRLMDPVSVILGRKINPNNRGPHAPIDYNGLTLINLNTVESHPISLEVEKGEPFPRVGFPRWSPDGKRFLFTLIKSSTVEAWVGDPHTLEVTKLTDNLNAGLSFPCAWLPPTSQHVVCLTRINRPEDHVAHLIESQMEVINVETRERRKIGEPKAFLTFDLSPNGQYILNTAYERPYPQMGSRGRHPTAISILNLEGRNVLQIRPDQLGVHWQPTQGATLVWIDKGSRVMALDAPFDGAARTVYSSRHYFKGIYWIENNPRLALIYEWDPVRRRRFIWRADLAGGENLLLEEVNSSNYAVPRYNLIMGANPDKKTIVFDGRGVYATTRGPIVDGTRPLDLNRIDLTTGKAQRLWRSKTDASYSVVDILTPDARMFIAKKQSASEPPDYYLIERTPGQEIQRRLTHSQHPASDLIHSKRIYLRYRREDGVPLGATLYLPPQHNPNFKAPLIVWAYPIEEAADYQVRDPNTHHFIDNHTAFRLFFLKYGYAVLDDVSMPIISRESRPANDTFIEQIKMNAEAALKAVAETNEVDIERVGVAGHSFGASMVANLLVHTQLFKAGVALSGAYDRRLTPNGFQTERRTLQEAPAVYEAMSPILHVHPAMAPLLLVHGALDQNAGATPKQSEAFAQKLRETGVKTHLIMLPNEDHTYRARESVLEVATEMLTWFNKNLVKPVENAVDRK